MDAKIKHRIDEAATYREKAILYLLLAFDDDNDRRIKHIYENIQFISKEEEGNHGNNNQRND